MNDLTTDSSVAAAVKAQQGGVPASSAGGDDPEASAFLGEVYSDMTEMESLRNEFSRLRAAHEASRHAVFVGSVCERAPVLEVLARLIDSAGFLHKHLASMSSYAPDSAVQATERVLDRVNSLVADVEAFRLQIISERHEDAARRYLALAGDAPTEEQLHRLHAYLAGAEYAHAKDQQNRLLANTDDSDAAMREARLSAAPAAVPK